MKKQINLEPYDLLRPEKISWRFPVGLDIFSVIKSKSLVNFLKKSDQMLLKNDLSISYVTLNKVSFLEWLPYYQSKMNENNYESLANSNWYDKKIEQGLSVQGIMMYQKNQLVGSLIFTQKHTDFCSIAFRASDKIDLRAGGRASTGALLDYLFLKYMSKQKMKLISAGTSRNAFGIINTVGNLNYKLRFGLLPQPAKKSPLTNYVPINDLGYSIFFAFKNNKFSLITLKPTGFNLDIEGYKYLPNDINLAEIEY